jgi:hypothetical protein
LAEHSRADILSLVVDEIGFRGLRKSCAAGEKKSAGAQAQKCGFRHGNLLRVDEESVRFKTGKAT